MVIRRCESGPGKMPELGGEIPWSACRVKFNDTPIHSMFEYFKLNKHFIDLEDAPWTIEPCRFLYQSSNAGGTGKVKKTFSINAIECTPG